MANVVLGHSLNEFGQPFQPFFIGGTEVGVTYSPNNSVTLLFGVRSSWERVQIREEIDGSITYSNWAFNIWQIPVMQMADFHTLHALQGTSIDVLVTNNIFSRNAEAEYEEAFLEDVVNVEQQGIQALNTSVRFRVKVGQAPAVELR